MSADRSHDASRRHRQPVTSTGVSGSTSVAFRVSPTRGCVGRTSTRPGVSGRRGVAGTRTEAPAPTAFTARSSKVYSVPFLRFETSTLIVFGLVPRGISTQRFGSQLTPPSVLCRYSFRSSGEPLASAGSQAIVTWRSPSEAVQLDRGPGGPGATAAVGALCA